MPSTAKSTTSGDENDTSTNTTIVTRSTNDKKIRTSRRKHKFIRSKTADAKKEDEDEDVDMKDGSGDGGGVADSLMADSTEGKDENKGTEEEEESPPTLETEDTKAPADNSDSVNTITETITNNTATVTAETTNTTDTNPEKNPYDDIRYSMVRNDGQRMNLIRLIGLKSLFAKQLPKMPKEYIVRLVFDRRHVSLAILDDATTIQHNPPTTTTTTLNDETIAAGGGEGADAVQQSSNSDPVDETPVATTPATLPHDDEIIAGICYRPYKEMRFAEIAFCAVNGTHQVKGYGTKLMNLAKRQAVAEGIDYFITYADNYAIGYFKKQGFTKTITMPKSRFHGLIKDYDGANLMECYIHPSIDFTRVPQMIEAQRKFIMDRIRAVSKSDKVVYSPLKRKDILTDEEIQANSGANAKKSKTNNAQNGASTTTSTAKGDTTDPASTDASTNAENKKKKQGEDVDCIKTENDQDGNKDKNKEKTNPSTKTKNPVFSTTELIANHAYNNIPGIKEAGWTKEDVLEAIDATNNHATANNNNSSTTNSGSGAASTRGESCERHQRNLIKSECLNILRKIEDQQYAWPFREPVDTREVKDYLDVIKDPIDLSTIEKKIRKGEYTSGKSGSYGNMKARVHEDLLRVVNNCKVYNDQSSSYYECAVNLEKFIGTLGF